MFCVIVFGGLIRVLLVRLVILLSGLDLALVLFISPTWSIDDDDVAAMYETVVVLWKPEKPVNLRSGCDFRHLEA